MNNDQIVLSGSEDCFVYAWSLTEGSLVDKFSHVQHRVVHSIASHPSKPEFLAAAEGTLYLWQQQSDQEDSDWFHLNSFNGCTSCFCCIISRIFIFRDSSQTSFCDEWLGTALEAKKYPVATFYESSNLHYLHLWSLPVTGNKQSSQVIHQLKSQVEVNTFDDDNIDLFVSQRQRQGMLNFCFTSSMQW